MSFVFLHRISSMINRAILVMQERENNQLSIAGIKQLLVAYALPKTRILSSGVAGICSQPSRRCISTFHRFFAGYLPFFFYRIYSIHSGTKFGRRWGRWVGK